MAIKRCKTGAGFNPGVPLCLQCGDDCQCFGCREADAKRAGVSRSRSTGEDASH